MICLMKLVKGQASHIPKTILLPGNDAVNTIIAINDEYLSLSLGFFSYTESLKKGIIRFSE